MFESIQRTREEWMDKENFNSQRIQIWDSIYDMKLQEEICLPIKAGKGGKQSHNIQCLVLL